jgi:cyclopropane-fatty-acyl-phospholipid synthase
MSKAKKILSELLQLADVNIDGTRPFDIRIKDERFYKRVLGGRELGLGESYMDGWWEVERLDELVARVLSAGLRNQIRITPEIIKTVAWSTVQNRQSIRKAGKNAAHHYNVGNDLYKLMLDRRMIYSCGYWKNADNLDKAQEDKLELICKKLELKAGMSLLDIGCGWGGFAKYAAEKYKVKVVGITPAAEQVKLARERTRGLPVEIKQLDYREVSGTFDRIVSIGMLEHVGPKNYKIFFNQCKQMLKDDGIMLHHAIGNNRSVNATDVWIDKYIFPGGVIPSLAQISRAVEKNLIIEDVHNFGPDYDKTLMAWHSNFVRNYPKLKDSYDERFYRMWEFYLLSCAGAFRARNIQLWQIVMRKIRTSDTYMSVR